jgi:hypothetical protein
VFGFSLCVCVCVCVCVCACACLLAGLERPLFLVPPFMHPDGTSDRNHHSIPDPPNTPTFQLRKARETTPGMQLLELSLAQQERPELMEVAGAYAVDPASALRCVDFV